VALAHRLHCDLSERRVHLLAHALLLPADGLQVATGRLQIRVPEPQLHRPHVNASQQMHTSEGVAELVEVELLANRVVLAGDWLPEVLRIAVSAIQLAAQRNVLEIPEQVTVGPILLVGEDQE